MTRDVSNRAAEWVYDDDKLMLLECWARDGYTNADIAMRMGIGESTLCEWRKRYEEIENALSTGREIIDYKVENALLKSALGYRTTETKITVTTDATGTVMEEKVETIEKEIAPNTTACQVWLYNRLPKKWKKNRDSILDNLDEDTSIEIKVVRAGDGESSSNEDDEEWNEGVEIKKPKSKKRNGKAKTKNGAKSENEEKGISINQIQPDMSDWDDENEDW